MAIKATIYKAAVQIADMDRNVYADHALTLALHLSETEERLMMRLLAFALNVPADDHNGALTQARGLSEAEDPDLWQHDLSGQLLHWLEVGQPDERRITRACGKANRVTVYAYAASVPVWWQGIKNKLTRVNNLALWQIAAEQSQALVQLAQRSMQLQITVQDGTMWFGNGQDSIEVQPIALQTPTR